MTLGRALLWSCSLAGLGFSLAAAWFGPPSLWVVGLVLLTYVAVILAGVFFPRLGMYATMHREVPGAERQLALTFDDGPHPQTTLAVLDILERHEAVATFFVVGHKVDKYPEVVRTIVARGHALGLHGYQHDRLFALKPPAYVADDIEKTRAAVERACGVRPKLFRPPIGFVSPRTAAGARRAQAPLVGWSVRAYDGTGPVAPERVMRRIECGLRSGAIVLLHDAAEHEDFTPAAVDALPRILESIQKRGLTTVTVDELLGLNDDTTSKQRSPGRGRARRTLTLLALCLGVLGIATSCENVRTVTPNPQARPTDATRTATPPRAHAPAPPSADVPPVASTASLTTSPRRIYIHPLGPSLPDADADFVRTSLAAFYAMDVLTLPRSPLPSDAYYRPRSRYRAEKLLTHLQASLPEDGFRVLGLTGHDISTTKDEHEDWGILGLASVDGEACVISTFRTKQGAKNAEHARVRLGKTAVHEIGHTLGLPHCPNPGCLMEDARGTVATTDTEYDLCHDCRARLEAAGYVLATGTTIPWPRPGE